MKSVRIVPAARDDLRAIAARIAADDPPAAARYLEGLRDAFRHVAEWPMSGRDRGEYRPGLRSFVHRDHLIFYRPSSAGVTILRVLHGRRDFERLIR